MMPKHKKSPYFCTKGLFNNLSNFIELERRIAHLPENERGDAFEVFAEAYLATQSIHQVEELWPEKALPQSLREELNIPSDAGIDGIFKTFSGDFKAYQVKFRSKREALSWGSDGLGNFFGQADRVNERVLFTNSVDLTHFASSRVAFYSVRGNELDNLTSEDLQAIEKWLKTGIKVYEKLSPRVHQIEAIEAIVKELSVNNRATAIMACGTGKTLVALNVAETMNAKAILVLLPSLALIRQTLHDWARNHNWESFNFLCVCSDDTVVKSEDEIRLHQQDLDFTVTTQSEDVARFLALSNLTTKIIFSTYQSCRIVAKALPQNFAFDLAIFDEAHKTASRSAANYAFALKDNNILINKRLFLTATPRHYNIAKKDKSGDQQLVFSMDDETVYGRVAYKLSFRAAVEQDLICNYKVIISVITSDMVNRELLKHGEVVVDGDVIKAQRIANILAIQKAVEQYDVNRIFSFHSSVSAAKSFTAKSNEGVGAYLGDFTTMHVNGEMSTSKREAILNEFRDSKSALISNARCLTEGVNVPAVDMVAFISPKKSKVDIVQAAGRAMRKHESKKCGYILIPLFVQSAEQEGLEQALAKTKFDTVWDVLQAMCEQDESLVEVIAKLRETRGRSFGINDNRLRDFVEVVGPELMLRDLRDAITTKIISNIGVLWDERFGELLNYKEAYGHCNVPQHDFNYPVLGCWVSIQRTLYRQNNLSLKKIDKLQSIGFIWNIVDAKWREMFLILSKYYADNGHCNVPNNYSEQKLSIWVKNQRQSYREGILSSTQIDQLMSINFVWNIIDERQRYMFTELCKYREKYGNCDVPQKYPENLSLGTWVSSRRQAYNRNELSSDDINLLESIGFLWDPVKTRWELLFEELCEYRKIFGHCNVPAKYPENQRLAGWVSQQRKAFQRKKLLPEQLHRLESIGLSWNSLETKWENLFEELSEYHKINGHCNVPARYPENQCLAGWVSKQREGFKNGLLSQDRIDKLKSIDFVWDLLTSQWDTMFIKLCYYYDKHGNANVPQNYSEDKFFARWVSKQREAFKNGKLSQDRINKLESINFVWDAFALYQEQMFSALCAYRDKYGHCDVSSNYAENPALGIWVSTRRRAYKSNLLQKNQIDMLNSIGFSWTIRK